MDRSGTKNCQNCKSKFVIEPQDSEFYEKVKVPPPTFCPTCRFQRKYVWRNHRALYKRKCNATGHSEEMVSMYHPDLQFRVYDRELGLRSHESTLSPDNLPQEIKDVDDSILKQTIGCAHKGACVHQCTAAFKIIPKEFQFYKRMNLSVPRLCPNCRHYQRIKQRNPLKLWHRKCTCGGSTSENGVYQNAAAHFHGTDHCPNEFETSYLPERPEIVYCERCYQAEVV